MTPFYGLRTTPDAGVSYTTSSTAGGAVEAMGTADGNFVVSYADTTAGTQRFFYKLVDAAGQDVDSPVAFSPTGSVTSLQTETNGYAGGSTNIVRLNDGKIAIVYGSGTQGGTLVLDANGGAINPSTPLTFPNAVGPLSVTATQNGGFAIAFKDSIYLRTSSRAISAAGRCSHTHIDLADVAPEPADGDLRKVAITQGLGQALSERLSQGQVVFMDHEAGRKDGRERGRNLQGQAVSTARTLPRRIFWW